MSSVLWLLALVCDAAAGRDRTWGFLNEVLSLRSLAADVDGVGDKLKASFPFYHTGEELRSEMARLASGCRGDMSFDTIDKDEVSIDAVHVKGKGAQPVNRVFLMCGEHSRELISSESCLHLLKQLCGEAQLLEGSPTVEEVLQNSEFQLVLNANPRSRREVESGSYCVRGNPKGIDLNRNWGDHFVKYDSDTDPGPSPFSEAETQIHKELVAKFKPTTYLSIHSGTLGMYMPWAYDMEHLATRNREPMMNVLRSIDEKYCRCPYGAAGKEVGYSAPGTSLDFVYDKLNASFSFAFEIWAPPQAKESLESWWTEMKRSNAAALLESGNRLKPAAHVSFLHEHTSDSAKVKGHKSHSDSEDLNCFHMFNPSTQELYERTVQNWAAVYLETADLTSRKLKGEGSARKVDDASV